MTTSSENLGDFIKLLEQRKKGNGKIIVFAGAAISIAAPSFLPDANTLLDATLDVLFDTNVTEILKKANIQVVSIRGQIFDFIKKRIIPSEMLYDVIYEYAGHKVFSALECLRHSEARPNHNHIILARLVSEGYIDQIITTNFDGFLEANTTHRSGFFEKLLAPKKPIWKIHGDFSDSHTMITTFRRVGKRLFDAKMLDKLKDTLENSHVLFIGYGASDADIIPALTEAHMQRVYWNVLDEIALDDNLAKITWEKIKSNSKPLNWIVQDLNEVLDTIAEALHFDKVALVRPNFDEEKAIAKRRLKESNAKWENDQNLRMTTEEKLLSILHLLYNVAPLDDTLWNLIQKIAHQCQSASISLSQRAMNELDVFQAEAFLQLHVPDANVKAAPHLKRVLSQTSFDRVYVQCLIVSSVIAMGEGNPKAANAFLTNALKFCGSSELRKYEHREQLEARVWANLGLLHDLSGQFDDSLRSYQKAGSLFQHSGDLHGYFQCCSRIADIYLNLRKCDEALKYYKQANKIDAGLPTVGGFPKEGLRKVLSAFETKYQTLCGFPFEE